MKNIIVLPLAELLSRLAQHFVSVVTQQVAEKGGCFIALTGGNTCRPFYQLLATPMYSQQVPWDKVHVFLTDERISPPELAGSNFQTVWDFLLRHVPIAADKIYRVVTKGVNAVESARLYSKQMQHVLEFSQQQSLDWVLLGLGEDGHVASLFPGNPILHSTESYADASYSEKLASWRVSMTYTSLLKAKEINLLVTGLKKQNILKKLLQEDSAIYPVSRIMQEHQNCLWFIDQEARKFLNDNGI